MRNPALPFSGREKMTHILRLLKKKGPAGRKRQIKRLARGIFSTNSEVKIAILKTDGDNTPDPSTLADTEKMSVFKFSDIQYIRLTDRFTGIAQKTKPGAKIKLRAVTACITVKDCVDLVTKAGK